MQCDVGKLRLVTIDGCKLLSVVYCLQISTFEHIIALCILIFNKEKLHNFKSTIGPSRELDYIALIHCTHMTLLYAARSSNGLGFYPTTKV